MSKRTVTRALSRAKSTERGKASAADNIDEMELVNGDEDNAFDDTQVAMANVIRAIKRIENSGFSSVTYFLGVCNTGFTPFILGAFPELFAAWFCFKVTFLIGRLIQLRFREKKQFYFLDLCWFIVFATTSGSRRSASRAPRSPSILFPRFSLGPFPSWPSEINVRHCRHGISLHACGLGRTLPATAPSR